MRILTKYLLRAHIGPFFFALTVLTGLLLVNTVARRFEELAGKGLPASVIAEVFVLSVPHIIALTLPMAVLVSVLYAFSRLTADNEVTAMKASGVHLARLLLPLLVAAGAVTAGMIYFNDRILPETNHRLKNLLVDIARKSPTLELEQQVINPIETGDMRTRYFLQAATIEPATNRLWDVVIYDLSEPGQSRTIYADSGRMAFNRDRTDLFLTLHDGRVHEADSSEPEQFQRMFFERQLIRIEGVGNRLDRSQGRSSRGDREMSLAQLLQAAEDRERELAKLVDEARDHALTAVDRVLGEQPADSGDAAGAQADSPPSSVSPAASRAQVAEATRTTASELRVLEGRVQALEGRVNQYRVEYHKKYSIPFACIVFVLIGAPIAVRFPRGGVGMVIAVSLGVFAVYYMGLIGGEELADAGIVAPAWAMWAPNILFLGLGAWGVVRIGYEVSTARGGGWDDLRFTLRQLMRHPIDVLRLRAD